jgi:ABC-type Mn2+/Zn2+ transport system ATPase subunit
VRELSKGNRQKIGLVLAFMHHPELLVLDEPTSGLDPLMQHEFENLLRETTGQGQTVFLSSHELDEVQDPVDLVCCRSASTSCSLASTANPRIRRCRMLADITRLELTLRRRSTIGYAAGMALYTLAVVAL